MFILYVVSFCFDASHVYLDEGTPFKVILTIYLILAVSIETALLKVNIPYNFPFCEKVYKVYFNGSILHCGVVDWHCEHVRF